MKQYKYVILFVLVAVVVFFGASYYRSHIAEQLSDENDNIETENEDDEVIEEATIYFNLIGEKSLSERDIITLTNLETEGEAQILAIIATDLYEVKDVKNVDIKGGHTLITSNYLPALEVNIDTKYDWILTANYEENKFVFEKKIGGK